MRLERWRASVLMRVTTWVLFGVFVVLAVAVQFDGPWEPSVLLLAVGLVALGAFFPYVASGYIDLFEDVVVIDGWWRRLRSWPWSPTGTGWTSGRDRTKLCQAPARSARRDGWRICSRSRRAVTGSQRG